jgi:hypothetical protein
LYFTQGDTAAGIRPRFSYYCAASSPGWTVLTDGSIHPPSRSRVIQIGLDRWLNNGGSTVRFAGFRIGSQPDLLPSPNWTPQDQLESLGVEVATPEGTYPPPGDTTPGPLTLTLGTPELPPPHPRLFYCLAVQVGTGSPEWDDPKIYDDGSQ